MQLDWRYCPALSFDYLKFAATCSTDARFITRLMTADPQRDYPITQIHQDSTFQLPKIGKNQLQELKK